jgi:PAS domain S-box-containing protein
MAAELSSSSSEACIRVLLLEDSPIDAELVIGHLSKAGIVCDIKRAATRSEFIAEFKAAELDIVLADYSLPDFDGLSALELVRAASPDLPFIFVSGVVGEEFAINALRRGATDYVMKRGMNRLPAALDRAIAETRERQERQRAEQALRVSETSAQLAIDAAGLGKWEFDPHTQQLEWDVRCKMLFGLPLEESVTHEQFLKQCHVEDRDRIERALLDAIRPGSEGKISEECRIIRRSDGEERWLSLTGRCFFEGQVCTRFIGMVADITERKNSETALQELNQTLKLRVARQTAERDHLWQLSQDLLAVTNLSGVLLETNPAWSTLLGHRMSEILGNTFSAFAHPADAELIRRSIELASKQKLRPFECRLRCTDGSYRWISWSAAPGHGCVYVVGRDVTEDKEARARLEEAQDALRQSQKMEAVGQLTGGVAHDFNNLLQVVVGNLETLQRRLPENLGRLRRAADNAMAGAQRAAHLTQHLLAFSRRQPLNPRPVAINNLVAGMSDMLERTLGEHVEIETRLDAGLWHVEIDENQLESALLNLAVNARDAMPQGGRLLIQTNNLELREDGISNGADLQTGQYVVISVTDNGTGMTSDVMARAFEPFFTTKSVGHGTGLGLSQVYGFVNQSGGKVKIASQPGVGTAIQIYLPRLHQTMAMMQQEEPRAIQPASVRGTVLVVEDDPDVRGYTVDTIRDLGYEVLEARDGPSALKVLHSIPYGTIDLLFTDVVLPGGLNGKQLAERAVDSHPYLKVIFATGYARDAIVHDGRVDAGVQLITKPFVYNELATRLRAVLEAQPGQAPVREQRSDHVTE